MHSLRDRIVNYYDDLRNQIDIECEKILADKNINDCERVNYNFQRKNYLEKIEKSAKINIEHLKYIKENTHQADNDEEDIGPILFKNHFCFHLKKTNLLENVWNKLDLNRLGKLIITNCYLDPYIRSNLQLFVNSEELEDVNFSKSESRQCIVYGVFEQLLVTNWPGSNDIIDLTSSDKIPIKKISLKGYECETLEDKDIDLIIEVMKEQNISSESLKELDFEHEFLSAIKVKIFNKLPCLEILRLNDNDLTSISGSYFNGLNNLKNLDLSRNDIKNIEISSFVHLINLACLNLSYSMKTPVDMECFNMLENLEFLSLLDSYFDKKIFNCELLNLPKLKHLTIISDVLPEFKTLDLNYLHVLGIKELNKERLECQANLKGVSLALDSNLNFDCIKKDVFEKLTSLSYLSINFYDLTEEHVEYLNKNEEYFKSFLCRKSIPKFSTLNEDFELYEVSNYPKIEEFINNEIDVSELTKQILIDYHSTELAAYPYEEDNDDVEMDEEDDEENFFGNETEDFYDTEDSDDADDFYE